MSKHDATTAWGVMLLAAALIVIGVMATTDKPAKVTTERCPCQKFGPERPCCDRCFCCEAPE